MNPKTQLVELCQQFNITICYVFGSRAAEVQQWIAGKSSYLDPANLSDIDIGIKLKNNTHLTVYQKVAFAQALETAWQVERIDLVLLEEADPFLAVNIIRGERLYADDSYLADEYDLYVMRRAGDLAPFERQRLNAVLEV